MAVWALGAAAPRLLEAVSHVARGEAIMSAVVLRACGHDFTRISPGAG